MATVLAILNIFSAALAVLKQIPETSAIATEIQDFETALTNAIASATTAYNAAKTTEDPTQLQPITPVP